MAKLEQKKYLEAGVHEAGRTVGKVGLATRPREVEQGEKTLLEGAAVINAGAISSLRHEESQR